MALRKVTKKQDNVRPTYSRVERSRLLREVEGPTAEMSEEDMEILVEAYEFFDYALNWESRFRDLYIQDVKFANADSDNGWQWPDDMRRDRMLNRRPALTINKVQNHINLVVNDGRQNKAAIEIKPAGKESSFAAAQGLEALIRNIEYQSSATAIYDDMSTSQVEGGVGYGRVISVYPDPRSFNQELRIVPVDNHLNVFLDPDIKLKSGLDSKKGLIFSDYTRDEYEREFDEPAPVSSTPLGMGAGSDWIKADHVRVAEYYRINVKPDELVYFKHGNDEAIFLRSEVPRHMKAALREAENAHKAGLLSPGIKLKTRPTEVKNLQWYKIAAHQIKDRKEYPTQYIPIFRFVGRERVIDDKLERKGLTRTLKDAQRMYNYNPLSLNTPLPTPTGWTTMGQVETGDWLLDEKGQPVEVISTSPVFLKRECYRVNFDDGSHIISDGEHPWVVEERGARRAKTYNWLKKTLTTNQLIPGKHFIYANKSLSLPDVKLPVHPYVLGLWLGDGDSGAGRVTAHIDDVDETRALVAQYGYTTGEPYIHPAGSAATFTIFGLAKTLSTMGLLGCKHIPQNYLRASNSQREMLLRGLMDTDGHITKIKQCIFVNTRKTIADGFAELLRTLGIKANFQITQGRLRKFPSGNVSECQDAWRFNFSVPDDVQVFELKRKADKQAAPRRSFDRHTKRHKIVSVIKVPSVPVKCVTIDSESHLFLAGPGMVPTHNSSAEAEAAAMATKTNWLVPMEGISGFNNMWDRANVDNKPYLPFRHKDRDGDPIPPPQRIDPAKTAEAYLSGMEIASRELEMASGQGPAQFGKPTKERSGIAIQQTQRQGDILTYDFIDNQALGIQAAGVILLDWIPHCYDTKQVVQVLDKDGTERMLTIDPQAAAPYEEQKLQDQVQAVLNPRIGQYKVQAQAGPAYATQRQEAWNAFVQIITGAPDLINEIGDLMFLSADFPMADEIAQRIRRKIKQLAPWLLDDNAVNPQVQQLQQQIQQGSQQIAELLQQLAEKERKLKDQGADIAIKAAKTSDDMRRTDIAEQDSQTRRITAVTNAQLDLDRAGDDTEFQKLVKDLVKTTLNNHIAPDHRQPVPDEQLPAEEKHQEDEQEDFSEPRQADDGHHYIRHNGQHYKVDTAAMLGQQQSEPTEQPQ